MLETILLIVSVLIIAVVLLQGAKASDGSQIISGGNETLFQNMRLSSQLKNSILVKKQLMRIRNLLSFKKKTVIILMKL